MDNEVSSDELGEQRCGDLEVPLFTSDTFQEVVTLYLNDMEDEQWMFLAVGNIDADAVMLLADLCHEIVEMACSMVLDEVTPQVCRWMFVHNVRNSSNTSVTTNGTDTPQRERNYRTVTEDDIQASLGNSLHRCLGEALGVVVETSDASDKLLQLVAEAVANKVNHRLAGITQSTSSQRSEESVARETPECETKDMVYFVAKILSSCLVGKNSSESPDEEDLVRDASQASSPDDMTLVDEFSTVATKGSLPEGQSPDLVSDLSRASSPDDVTSVEEFSTEAIEGSLSEGQSPDLSISVSSVPPASTTEELLQGEKTFLAVFLAKLLDHITHSTKTSVLELDFEGLLKSLRRTVGEISFPLPPTVENLHLTIFQKLCQEFGSTKLLQAIMSHEDVVFQEVVARELKAELQKATRNPPTFVTKVRRFFGTKSTKVAPACEADTSVSSSEVVQLENGSTPLLKKKEKRPAFIRMFSAVARMVRKPCTSCSNGG